MKKLALLLLLPAIIWAANGKARVNNLKSIHHIQADSDTLSVYTGKFQRVIHNDMFYIRFDLENGDLIGSTLWDGNKLMLKHLSGDNFIVSGINWGVKFLRGQDGKVNEVVVRGTDHWTKVKSN